MQSHLFILISSIRSVQGLVTFQLCFTPFLFSTAHKLSTFLPFTSHHHQVSTCLNEERSFISFHVHINSRARSFFVSGLGIYVVICSQ